MARAGSLPSSIQTAQVQDGAARWRTAKATDVTKSAGAGVVSQLTGPAATPVTLTTLEQLNNGKRR